MRVLAGLLALMVVLAGCSTPDQEATVAPADDPFPGCAAIVSDRATSGLPDLTLPCFHGGMSVRLSQVTGPAVVNLWASWCPSCRQELPAFEQLARRTGGKLTVLGVVTEDERDSAISVAQDLRLTFPAVFDHEAKLRSELVRLRAATSALPVTLFVKDGRLVYAYQGKALDQKALDQLVQRYLGVSA